MTFLKDVLAQPWAPKTGKAIELGCGTAPMLRWLHERGFGGLGVDVSKTAISMAKAQSKGLGLRFKRADLCAPGALDLGTFDLALDGRCLHCITQPEDRRAFLTNVRGLLRPGGLFIVLTMCAPIDRPLFAETYPNLRIVGHTIYMPHAKAKNYDGWRAIGGQDHVPSRYVGHWKSILTDIRRSGFRPRLIKVTDPLEEPNGDLEVGALAV
jgi:SAM-dependent methyltransferase